MFAEERQTSPASSRTNLILRRPLRSQRGDGCEVSALYSHAAIDAHYLTGYVSGLLAGDESHQVGNVVNLSEVALRNPCHNALFNLFRKPGVMVLTVTLRVAISLASDLVKPMIAALDAE